MHRGQILIQSSIALINYKKINLQKGVFIIIYVTSFDGVSQEPLINIANDFKMEQSTDGSFTVSFTCFDSGNNPGYAILRSKSTVHIDNYEFIVEQFSDTGFSKTVTCINSFFNNSKIRNNAIFSGSHTLNNHLNFALGGTGWSYTVDGNIGNVTNYIENFGEDNVVSLIEKVVKYHQVEYIIMPNKTIKFAKQIGGNYDYQYRYKHNLSDVILKEDTSNLYTVIRGTGSEGISAVYRSPNVSVFGELEADPISDERFTSNATLLNYISTQIQDVPELAIESTIPELTSRETGERIWLIYEPLNIEMQTRILKQTKVFRDGELITSSVVFGNTLIKSAVDLLVAQKQGLDDTNGELDKTKEELDAAQKEYRSRFDVTDNNIILQVERINQSIATIDIKADNINLSVNNRITNEVAAINIKANQIELTVNNRITNEVSAIDIRANMIDLSVQNLDSRTSSSINLLENNINFKIDRGGAITDINLSPGQATINADKINLNGAVFVNGMITGSTSIEVSTDVILGRGLRFSDFTALTTGGGTLTLEAFNEINYVGTRHNFSNANVYLDGKRVLTTDDL